MAQNFSQTEIANFAIVKIGGKQIANLNDSSAATQVINTIWTMCLADELRSHLWQFTKKRIALPASATPPLNAYGYAYPLPDDFLRLIQSDTWAMIYGLNNYDNAVNPQYAIESNQILCNTAPPLTIYYAAMVNDTTQWDVNFVNLFACRLAVELAETMTQDSRKRQLAQADYDKALKQAVRINAIERAPSVLSDGSWMISRL